tara:strand:- start:5186 stop:5533 length:348 start_codon:yes stop_codon:yes gene_type:complete
LETDKKLLDIEARLERMHNALQRQETELQSWRDRSVRIPNWIRNGGIALMMAVFAQSMAAVWWASKVENTQNNIMNDVKVNTEFRIQSSERYNEIMIELTKLQIMMETHFNKQDD